MRGGSLNAISTWYNVVWTGYTSYFGFSVVGLFYGRGRWVAFRKGKQPPPPAPAAIAESQPSAKKKTKHREINPSEREAEAACPPLCSQPAMTIIDGWPW